MGQEIAKQVKGDPQARVIAGIDRSPGKFSNNFPVYKDFSRLEGRGSVVIDFSHPAYLKGLLDFGINNNTPLVIGTTGYSGEEMDSIKRAAQDIPVFYSANTSIGVNMLLDFAKKAALVLNETFDIELIERHDNKKLDAPSGTAYMIAGEINGVLGNSKSVLFGRKNESGARDRKEIGIHSVRGGGIKSEHAVLFAGSNEVLELKHSTISDSTFAIGAVDAAKFMVGKGKGLYSMEDVINSAD